MTGSPADGDAPHTREGEPAPQQDDLFGMEGVGQEALHSWMREHQPELQRAAYGDRLLYQSLGFCLGLGLVVYVGGYLLRSSITTEPLSFLGDLLYTLGYALWTGAVVVAMLEVVPKVKRRQVREMLQAYERMEREAGERSKEGDA
jgi:hypothetical protein